MRSSAWICVFSSQHSTTERSGGSRYNPTTSQNLASNRGSFDSLKVRLRCGLRPCSRQMRPTLDAEMPTSAAVVRVLRRRMPGASWPALATTASTTAGAMVAFAPRPARSARPSSPSRSKRCDHLLTDVVDTPTARATSACFIPSPRSSTMRARTTSRAVVVAARTRRSSSASSSAVSSKTEMGRAIAFVSQRSTATMARNNN